MGRRVALAMAGLLALAGFAGCSTDSSSLSGGNVTATPTFSPGAGTYNTSQTVTVSSSTAGAVLYCTTDGSTPTASSPQCSQPMTVFKTQFLQAIAMAPGKQASAAASAGYTIKLNAAATPGFSPDGGAYTGTQQVTITSATTGANLYYTLDGSAPGPNSTLYTGPVTVAKSATLSAIAIASGFTNSGVRSAGYTISNGPAAPVISPAGGSFTAAQTVAITDVTPGTAIYYTTDGSTPTSSSTHYTGTFTVSSNQTVNAIAIAGGIGSTVTTAAFSINLPAAATPTFNPAAGTYSSAQPVTLASATPGAVIYYTVDGSTPTTASTQYTGAINVGSSETIKAIATAAGFNPSAVSSAAYVLNVNVPVPSFSPAAGTYGSAQTVTLADTDANASIYYTVDGSTPSASSTKYTAPITVSSTQTVSAIAIDGSFSSTVATAAYTINLGPSYTGKVMSGNSPVSGASVQMYAAGNTGYASSATVLTATAATTGADGTFTLNYNCPAAGGDLVYLVAAGGKVGSNSTPNTNLVFMTALGSCNSTLPSNPVVNEVTTVASAYALAQFASSATNVGASASNYEQGVNALPGLSNAFATVNGLVDLSTGLARTHTPDYTTDLSGDTNLLNNSVVPQARIHTLANVLNVCAADGGCSSLFSAATPASGTAPADTLQAILNIAQNPGNNASAVYNVVTSAGPFTPVLAAAPNDWTLAVSFTGGGVGFAPDIGITFAMNGSTTSRTDGKFLNTAMAIDATGNVWVTGFDVSRINTKTASVFRSDLNNGMIAKFTNQGAPLTSASQIGPDGTTVTFGGYIAASNIVATGDAGTANPQSIAIDTNGNAWVLGGSGTTINTSFSMPQGAALAEVTPDLTLAIRSILLRDASGFNTNVAYMPLTIDGANNKWTFFSDGLEKFGSDGTRGTADGGINSQGSPNGYGGTFREFSLIFDSTTTKLWSSDFKAGDLYLTDASTNTATLDYLTSGGVGTKLAAGTGGNVYGCPSNAQTFSVYNASSTSVLATYPISTGRGCGNFLLMDGNNHLFAVSGGNGGAGYIDEFAAGSSSISLMGSFTGTSNSETPTINGDTSSPMITNAGGLSGQKPLPPITGISSAAIDGSGNVWVLNTDTGTDASKGNVLVKFIGIAAPVVTPNSLALSYGQVGVRP